MFMNMNLIFMFNIISMIIILINFLASMKKNNRNKLTPFECGFDPLSKSRLPFSIQFNIISIVFLIFDVEIMIFFPMLPSIIMNNLNFNIMFMTLFIVMLTIGLYFESKNGALKWLY